VFGLKKSYFFFFFAAFFAGLAFFLVAMFLFSLSVYTEPLRYHIIAICSLYRVIEKNSQAKKTRAVAQFDDANLAHLRFDFGFLPRAIADFRITSKHMRETRMNTGDSYTHKKSCEASEHSWTSVLRQQRSNCKKVRAGIFFVW
jgi:hypothetical protein